MRTHLLSRLNWGLIALLVLGANIVAADILTLKEAYQDHIMVGVAVNRTITTGTAVKADNVDRTLDEVKSDIALVEAQFNQIVNENDLKWELIHPNEGPNGYDFAPADAFVEFGERNNMLIAGHTLVWHGQTPLWVFRAPGVAAEPTEPEQPRRWGRPRFTGPKATREQLLTRMRDHIHTVVGRYKGRIKVWDVVNEALADGGDEVLRNSLWREIIGDDFIAKAFQYAHEADPEAMLRYNDYGLENPAKRERLKKLIASLQEQGIPVHAIGTQTHINVSTTYETMDQTLADLASIGLPVHITELDVNAARRGQRTTDADIASSSTRTEGGIMNEADRLQAEAYANLFRAVLKHKQAVTMVTFWGANDAVSWLGRGRPLLFDGNNQPKPAFDAVIRVAREANENDAHPLAPYFGPTTLEPKSTDADGFIQRWLLLEPIKNDLRTNAIFTESYIRETFAKEYFPGQFEVIPKEGDQVTVADEVLTWHALDSMLFNVKLFRFAYGLEKPIYGVLFWAVTVIDCPHELKDVRLAVGSNSASMWWVNGQEAVGLFGDRRMVMDDCVSPRLTLKQGRNVIRGAVINGPGMSDFCVRLIDEQGEPVKDFKIDVMN